MFTEFFNHPLVQQTLIWSLPILFAITLHEAAHAYVALKLGDKTSYNLGRVTLNPIKHIDLIGTIILPLTLLLVNLGFVFGWAKPVLFDERNLAQPRRDVALIAVAGPLANILMVIMWMLVAKLGHWLIVHYGDSYFSYLIYIGTAGVVANLVFALVNLIPLLPLDGGRIVRSLLPLKLSQAYTSLQPYGIILLVILLASGALNWFLVPAITYLFDYLSPLMR